MFPFRSAPIRAALSLLELDEPEPADEYDDDNLDDDEDDGNALFDILGLK